MSTEADTCRKYLLPNPLDQIINFFIIYINAKFIRSILKNGILRNQTY